jgi:hypothetical protein
VCIVIPSGLCPLGLPAVTSCVFLFSAMCCTYPIHLTDLHLFFLIMFGEEYKSWTSWLCNFVRPLEVHIFPLHCSSVHRSDQIACWLLAWGYRGEVIRGEALHMHHQTFSVCF